MRFRCLNRFRAPKEFAMTLNRRFCRPEVGQATRRIVFALSALLLTFVDPATSRADIYRWDDATLVPGTEGIESGPDLQLDNRTLAYADLSGWNLLRSRLNSSDLTNAQLQTATLSNADLTGAVVAGANFGYTDFTKEQLYSTASYEAKNLRGIDLERNDLSHWNFSGQDLTNANFKWATLSSTDLTGADVTGPTSGPRRTTALRTSSSIPPPVTQQRTCEVFTSATETRLAFLDPKTTSRAGISADRILPMRGSTERI